MPVFKRILRIGSAVLLLIVVVRALTAAGVAPQQAPVQSPFTDKNFVLIASGTFQMGDSSDGPVHSVTLTHPFWMQETEVTQSQWQTVMGTNPSEHKDCPACPVDSVNYSDVQAFIGRLNTQPGKQYRLPTEAEWEYAARAGTMSDYGTPGDVTLGGWIQANSGGQTHPVGTLRPNAWGLFDMEGNVWEWVNDWYGPYPSNPIADPAGAPKITTNPDPTGGGLWLWPSGGQGRVLRGGSWLSNANEARSASRLNGPPLPRYNGVGFRLARTP